MAACTLASCGRIEEVPANDPETIEEPTAPQIAFTATLAPKGEEPQSKAITSGTEAGKEVLNVAWAADEQIAVYYQTGAESYATAIATVESVDAMTGEATITATLTGAIDGGAAKFVYPATLHNGTGQIDETALLSQNGNLTGANGISTKFDAAKGTGTITIKGLEASVGGTVAMSNQVCICKFRFDVVESYGSSGYPRNFSTPIIINDGNGHTYSITSDRTDDMIGLPRGFNSNDDIYVAMLPISDKIVTFSTTYSPNDYSYTAWHTTLTAGKFYRNLSIDMVKGGYDYYNHTISGSVISTVIVPDGGTLKLNDATISATSGPAIQCEGDATIILTGSNSVTTSTNGMAVILAGPMGKTLTIQGTGSLTARSNSPVGAGIGCNNNGSCGNIVINGGTITANGKINCAGIGSAGGGTCGDITINGGTITATAGEDASAIGAGYCGNCGNITIGIGVTRVTANRWGGEHPGPYSIGLGNHSYSIASTCGTITIGGTVYYDGKYFQNGGDTYLATSPLIYQP